MRWEFLDFTFVMSLNNFNSKNVAKNLSWMFIPFLIIQKDSQNFHEK